MELLQEQVAELSDVLNISPSLLLKMILKQHYRVLLFEPNQQIRKELKAKLKGSNCTVEAPVSIA
ncbi:hypothetical protein JXA85_01490, partial [Candidatus Woesearchaeota archaeon]|nr:hypothetical protein [Candidatus Woesearchaeota archaeon]